MDLDIRRLAAAMVAVVVVILGGVWLLSGPDDGIEDGREYGLAASYRAQIQYDPEQPTIPGRVFDFQDRNLPEPSILVPTRDERGVALVKLNQGLPLSTVKKSRIRVPEQTIEGIVYPAYEYVLWEYNMATVEVQGVEPIVIPRQ